MEWIIYFLKPVSIFGDIGLIEDYAPIYASEKENNFFKKFLVKNGIIKNEHYDELYKKIRYLCETKNLEIFYAEGCNFIRCGNECDELARRIITRFPFLSLEAKSDEGEIRLYIGEKAVRKTPASFLLPDRMVYKNKS